ncbi:unnamed protein product [Mytilus edulis]|uniref:IgGFc-binding protein N-terminal domain-containing protein n=1 Tax=Mytilus edulis TaxID=6550 RepID=A0A8S3TF41_MYTED|nr:unnamed protein product [Mytilus edulis]
MTAAGKEFVIAFLKNSLNRYEPYLKILTPFVEDVELQISTPAWNSVDSFHLTYTVNKSYPLEVKLPFRLRVQTSTVDNRIVYVKSSKPIFVFAADFQRDTGSYFLLYPVKTFGTEYIVGAFGNANSRNSELKSLLGCLAIHTDTEIRITPPVNQLLTFNKRTYKHDEEVVVTINRFQLAQIMGIDVTGSFVRSNKPIAVISGHEHVMVHGNSEIVSGHDMIMAQMPPVATLSNVYPVASTSNNDEELIRVFAVHDNTAFSIYSPGSVISQFIKDRTSYFEFYIAKNEGATVVADNPVQVIQISTSGDRFTGDPRMIVTLSLDSYVTEYMFVTTVDAAFPNAIYTHTVIIIVSESAKGKLYLDGKSIINIPHEGTPSSCGYANLEAIRINVDAGYHTLGCHLEDNEYCTVYLNGYFKNSQYGTAINRHLGVLGSSKSSSLQEMGGTDTGPMTTALFRVAAVDQKPSTASKITFYVSSFIECHLLCRQYNNCALVTFEKTQNTCKLFTMYAASSALAEEPGVVISIIA